MRYARVGGNPVDTVLTKLQVSTLQAALRDLRFSDGHIKQNNKGVKVEGTILQSWVAVLVASG